MAKKSAAQKIEDMLGTLEDLMKENVMDQRRYIADDLIKYTARRDAAELVTWAAESGIDVHVEELDAFRAGIRFVATLLVDPDYDY